MLGVVVALAAVFGVTHLLSAHWAILVVVVAGLALGALAMEMHAEQKGTPDSHWWDDDSCSGWRGF